MENNKIGVKDIKIIFMGTPEFGVVVLQKLLQKGYEPILVVTAPDSPLGRKSILTPSPVKTLARMHGLTIKQPFRVIELKDEIKKINPDLIIIAAYGYFIPKEIHEIPKFGALNVHPSLLPKFRGPSPIQTAIMEGELVTGATIIKIDNEIDHGPIITKKAIEMPPKIYYKDLEEKLAELGAELLVETLPKWLTKELIPQPQDDTLTSFTKIIKKEDGKIDWANSTAQEIERKIRALQPWPSTYTYWERENDKKTLKILEGEPTSLTEGKTPGFVYSTEENKIIVLCKSGSLIVKKLQIEGRNPTTDKEFVLGYEGLIGGILK